MTTANGTRAAGMVFGKQPDGAGMGRNGATVATAALGLVLLVGGLLHQARSAAPTEPPARANPYWVYREDAVIDGDPAVAARALIRINPYWVYQEDVTLNGDPAEAAMTAFRVNPYWTYAEDVVLHGNPVAPPGFAGEER